MYYDCQYVFCHIPAQVLRLAARLRGLTVGTTVIGLRCLSVCCAVQANACRTRLQAAIAAAAGSCVAVTPAAATTFSRLQLLYFASPGHDLSM